MGCERWGGWVWVKGEVKGTRVRVRWEVEVGFRVSCGVWGDKSGGEENWGQSMCKTIKNSIVNSNFADACAFEDVIAKNVNRCATSANWSPAHEPKIQQKTEEAAAPLPLKQIYFIATYHDTIHHHTNSTPYSSARSSHSVNSI